MSNIVNIDQTNAQEYLVDESFKRIVLVDFWADWCEPCKSLMPVLEKLANEYDGQFLLAKVNADEMQMIATQLGVRSLPTVLVFKDGQPVDGFNGAQPESAVRELLDKYLPKSWDLDLEKAQELVEAENYNDALPILRQAVADSNNQINIVFALGDVLLHLNRLDDVETLLSGVGLADQDETYKSLQARLELQKESSKNPEIDALEQALAASPDDQQLQMKLAVQYQQSQMHSQALELLYAIVRKDLNFDDGNAKKFYLDILSALGKSDPLAIQYQRKYYTLLY
jgi:putative thioredoxin